ncbi:efflux transporter outer membrane subunit [Terriglobus saanensis]|uniref:RND efflux system, outer membrane lipoprotein, NodT family n=1 Tax=Terriglobus saanensis (strain ATCC BAA-1853 / DSM 23119 / SP1PR4) TaxID=401053 RepID=E8V6X1_TERSS|nr:efflux transporter outer membrane subunit [Terriglobus saanensis]ADV84995.1 RND efflux system, outer membrane lipoprotein, NodT family [Terriglobus saanensis SP1PR4]
MKTPSYILAASAVSLLLLAGCKVGPNYKTPNAILAPAFKEAPPTTFAEGWKTGQPSDTALKGDWWTLFNDAQLNALEPQVDTANQDLKSAEANFRAARAQIGYSRSFEAPTISTAPSTSAVRYSANQPYFNPTLANNGTGNLSVPVDLNYEIDLWGRVRRGVTQARANAQRADADLENARLSLHAELAMDYFNLRGADAQKQLLDNTIKVYQDALKLTQDRYDGGVAPMSDVAQARTQLDQAMVQRTDVDIERAQNEHAIAVLIGQAPAALTIPPTALDMAGQTLPAIPGILPATLLERRPDIASQERNMAAANEQIGIAQAAYYPTLSLSAAAGFTGTSALNWFTWPSRFWAVGPQLSQTIFDAGRRRSVKALSVAQYDETVANYRQTTLTAFQQVEDDLAVLRVLENEARQQRATTVSAEQSQSLFETRYEGGVDTYLQVVTWQTAALNNQRNEIDILQRRLNASVLLIKALGGGWDRKSLPTL